MPKQTSLGSFYAIWLGKTHRAYSTSPGVGPASSGKETVSRS